MYTRNDDICHKNIAKMDIILICALTFQVRVCTHINKKSLMHDGTLDKFKYEKTNVTNYENLWTNMDIVNERRTMSQKFLICIFRSQSL